MKRFMVAIVLISACFVCLGAVSSSRLYFKTAGFSIQPLEDQPSGMPHQALMMFLQASDGFSPNVNVQIQPYAGTIDDYVTLSKKQFVAAKLKLIKETKLKTSSVLLEYSGKLQGRELHWYAKATSTGKTIYLVTATATEVQWRTVAAKLKTCVNSFSINKGEPKDALDKK